MVTIGVSLCTPPPMASHLLENVYEWPERCNICTPRAYYGSVDKRETREKTEGEVELEEQNNDNEEYELSQLESRTEVREEIEASQNSGAIQESHMDQDEGITREGNLEGRDRTDFSYGISCCEIGTWCERNSVAILRFFAVVLVITVTALIVFCL
eukprot:TRINITY_DN13592_c0_g1_i1.p1 TRINITY_DN13592_c0_g1~~TRINITY_DN13592_c0_g1_i1.p1  ORF type:complete len:156 (+),score=27.65 TRINITY_DN13592_c0_g1_i1:241-708(+)